MTTQVHTARRRGGRLALPAGLVASVLALGLTGCAPGATVTPETETDPGDTSISSEVTISKEFTTEPVTLKVAHYEAGGAGDTIAAMAADFEALYPNVTIELSYQAFADYSSSIKLILAGNSAPDVVELGQGNTHQAPLVEAGLLRPIDDYAELYGWNDLYPGVLKNQNSVADDGLSFGVGKQYAVPLGGNIVGVYYNQAILDQVGLQLPFRTFAEFEQALETVKSAGIQPMVYGDQGGGPATHNTGALIAVHADPSEVRNWIFGQPGANIDTPDVRAAFEAHQRWFKQGYLNDDANGTPYFDAVGRFTAGDSAFIIGGSWLQPGIDEALGKDAGFFILPPLEAGGAPAAPGAAAGAFGISAASKITDVAAAFINFMANGEQAERLANGGFLPILFGDYTPASTGASLDDLIAEWNRMNANDGMSLFLDWATPSMGGETYFPSVQELAAGLIGPEVVTSRMQANWVEFKSR
jgi:raffinose/stachyose/melibiose transport system substrate-binding protein